jgi:hypothetical protein
VPSAFNGLQFFPTVACIVWNSPHTLSQRAIAETEFSFPCAVDDKKCILSQAALVGVFIKLAPWLRPQRHVSFPWAARRGAKGETSLAACRWRIPCFFSRLARSSEKANECTRQHMCSAPHITTWVFLFLHRVASSRAVTNG